MSANPNTGLRGGARLKAYLHMEETPEDALHFDYYPSSQSFSGGTHVGVKAAPGWSSDILHPRGRKAVDHKVSAMWNDYKDPKAEQGDTMGAAQAFLWVLRNLGGYGGDDDSNVF